MKRRFFTSLSSFVDYDATEAHGFTDITSNAVFLTDLAPLRRVAELRDGRLDLKFLPGILHECAHHVTFDSLVGCAMSALWSSSFSNWILQAGTTIPEMPARDLAVIRVVHTLFQPLIEGLALFAEYDMVTGNSPVVSRVTQHSYPLFTKGRLQEILGVDDTGLREIIAKADSSELLSRTHTSLLEKTRTDESWAERKAWLWSQPIAGPHRYLLGYLAVKGMYHTLSNNCPPLRDPEVFFVLLVQHFFQDLEMARLLLTPPPKPADELEAYLNIGRDIGGIIERFQDLADELYSATGKVARKALEPLLGLSGRRGLYGSDLKAGEELPVNLQIFAGMRTVGMFNIAWPRLLKHRSDFRFSFQEVNISVSDEGEVVIHNMEGEEICRTIAVPDSARGTFRGSIEAVRLRNLTDTVVCILAHDGLVGVLDCATGEWNLPHQINHLDDLPSAVSIEGAMHAFAKWQQTLMNHEEVRDMVENYEKQAEEAVDLLYPQLVCHGWELDRRKRLMDTLKDSGVAVFFPDEKQRQRVAKISLLAGVGSQLDAVAQEMSITSNNLISEIININHVSYEQCGFKLFDLSENVLQSKV